MRKRDLTIDGVNLSERLASVDLPLLCIVAAHDGIVPRGTAEFSFHQMGTRDKQLLVVGDRQLAIAHADLFVATAAKHHVFDPIIAFLSERSGAPGAKAIAHPAPAA
jgi:esterase/lipase